MRTLVLLDGALGTALADRGFELRAPMFGARALIDAPELLEQLHWDYLLAGAQVLTTNSFGLHVGTLALAGLATRQAELIGRSLAPLESVRRRALVHDRSLASFRIAGSIPPRLEPAPPELARAEYRRFAELLLEAGADLILLETFTSVAEARLALEALDGLGQPVWLSVVAGAPVPGSNTPDGSKLAAGDSFTALAELLDERPVGALMLNCTQIDAVPSALRSLLDAVEHRLSSDLPLGLSPHLGRRRYDGVWVDRIIEPEVFAEQLQAWLEPRPRFVMVGACCGSNPDYIAALRERLQPDDAHRQDAAIRLAELVP